MNKDTEGRNREKRRIGMGREENEGGGEETGKAGE